MPDAVAEEKPKKKGPRQEQLPGIENRAIKELEDLARDYKEVQKDRMALTVREVELQQSLITAMHKLKRTEYRYGNLEVTLTVEKEKVRVKIKPSKDDEADDKE
jgi:hypothetical protein